MSSGLGVSNLNAEEEVLRVGGDEFVCWCAMFVRVVPNGDALAARTREFPEGCISQGGGPTTVSAGNDCFVVLLRAALILRASFDCPGPTEGTPLAAGGAATLLRAESCASLERGRSELEGALSTSMLLLVGSLEGRGFEPAFASMAKDLGAGFDSAFFARASC